MSRRRQHEPNPTETCPHCGATFRAGRLACPECGSDASTGWRSSEDIDYLSVDLPENDATGSSDKARPSRATFAVTIVLVLVLILWLVLGGI